MSTRQSLEPLFEDGIRVPDFFFDPKTKIIYFSKSINNQRVKFSTKVRVDGGVTKARRFANAELTRRMGRKKNRISPLIKDELENWVKVKDAEGHKPMTMKNVRNAAKQLLPFWGNMFCNEINRDSLPLYYEWFGKEYPDQQLENSIKYLRNFCRYLAEKVVDGVPLLPAVPKISNPQYKSVRAHRKKRKEQIFTDSDFKAIWSAASSIEERVICIFMYTMATRIDETLNLRFGKEVFLDQETPEYRWSVGQNKADLWGSHDLHPALIGPLKELRAARQAEKTDRLFPQRNDKTKALKPQMIDWDGWRKRADIGWHWTSHTFRHTCLSNLFNDEKNPQALILKLYRVSLAVALETYIKPTPEGRSKMRAAIRVNL